MTSTENIGVALVIIALMAAVLAWGAMRTLSRLSETDKMVLGCWSGQEKNRTNQEVEIGLLIWSGGDYTIVESGFAFPVVERGKYTTSALPDGSVSLKLEPDTLGRNIEAYPQFGKMRTTTVIAQKLNGIRTLQFDGGVRYVNTSCEPYAPQVN